MLAKDDENSDFPRGAFTRQEQRNGAFILYGIGLVYMFIGLAIVCDDYFVSALEVICETFDLEEDVAGATFMAAGGSAPELFTSIIGTFVTQSDVGFSTIVGSAVFNVLFVIGLCAVGAKSALELTWYPLTRDSICYTIALLVLVVFVRDQEVHWWEALVMLLLYFGYVVVMKYNTGIRAWAQGLVGKSAKVADEQQTVEEVASVEAAARAIEAKASVESADASSAVVTLGEGDADSQLRSAASGRVLLEPIGKDDKEAADESLPGSITTPAKAAPSTGDAEVVDVEDEEPATPGNDASVHVASESADEETTELVPKQAVSTTNAAAEEPADATADAPNTEAEADEEEESLDPEWPDKPLEQAWFVFTAPLVYMMYWGIPDCRREKWKPYFMLSFAVSILFIGGYSYVMVWMADELARTAGIPEAVMGVTVLAGGTSIPDALSSLIVARNGHGDMAVSSSIGSNIFDICVGLPIPWLLYYAAHMFDAAQFPAPITILSDTLWVSVATLLGMLIATVLAIHFSGWKLNYKLGGACLVLYFVFIAESLLLEGGYIKV
jgi:sodium/potassium/calcium exchanger 2